MISTDSGPFSIIPEWVLFGGFSPRAIQLYCVLGRFADAYGGAHPSRKEIAERMDCSLDTVDRAVKELLDGGAIMVATRLNNVSEYTVIRAMPHQQVVAAELRPAAPVRSEGSRTDAARNENKEKEGNTTTGGRTSNPIWDALAQRFPEPTTKQARSMWGKTVRELAQAGAAPDEIIKRIGRWPTLFPGATLTLPALVKWWDALGPPADGRTNLCGHCGMTFAGAAKLRDHLYNVHDIEVAA